MRAAILQQPYVLSLVAKKRQVFAQDSYELDRIFVAKG